METLNESIKSTGLEVDDDMLTLHVAVAVIKGPKGYLLSQRLKGKHLAGFWEFPGGKVEPGENFSDALGRELQEELGIVVTEARPLIRIHHQYPEKRVVLSTWLVEGWEGTPKGLEGQPLRWVTLEQLEQVNLPPANAPIIGALKLPSCIAIANADQPVSPAMLNKLRSVPALRIRYSGESPDCYREQAIALLDQLSQIDESTKLLRLIIDIEGDWVEAEIQRLASFFPDIQWGLHIKAQTLNAYQSREELVAAFRLSEWPIQFSSPTMGASCHSLQEIKLADRLKVDYLFLSPVCATTTHPNAKPLGWAAFEAGIEAAHCPVYGLGGLNLADLEAVRSIYGQGIAGISWWK